MTVGVTTGVAVRVTLGGTGVTMGDNGVAVRVTVGDDGGDSG